MVEWREYCADLKTSLENYETGTEAFIPLRSITDWCFGLGYPCGGVIDLYTSLRIIFVITNPPLNTKLTSKMMFVSADSKGN